jgi:LAO/AO transport system kinase
MNDDRIAKVLAGDRRALSRVITEVENRTEAGRQALRLLYPHTGRAHTIGITGGAGAGKSTLTGALAKVFRQRGKKVAIVAVDPSSPFTQGAILGDRIRMQELTADPGVFVRSMATRGNLGGLSPTASDVVSVLDAAGFDIVMLETVGAGQDEVAVADAAQSTVVVNTPGTGDDIQAIKAGILEIADILVVNKADLAGADALQRHLRALLSLRDAGDAPAPPIIATVSTKNEGIVELADALEAHRRYLQESGRLTSNRRLQARHQLLLTARTELLRRLLSRTEPAGLIDELAEAVAGGRLDPYSAAEQLIAATEETQDAARAG